MVRCHPPAPLPAPSAHWVRWFPRDERGPRLELPRLHSNSPTATRLCRRSAMLWALSPRGCCTTALASAAPQPGSVTPPTGPTGPSLSSGDRAAAPHHRAGLSPPLLPGGARGHSAGARDQQLSSKTASSAKRLKLLTGRLRRLRDAV